MSRDDSTSGVTAPSKALRWGLAFVAVLLCGFWLFHRVTAAPKPSELRGLKVIENVVRIPSASFKTLDLLLPCSGTLALDVTVQSGSDVGVFVVAPGEIPKMKAKQTFVHVEGFDAQQTREYKRSGQLPPGKYCLVIMDRSSGELSSASSAVLVNARLAQLR